tara:strand:- start:287 stop:529 length:243 start_codon:yes stop_codon:yes gene_type:complete
MEIEIIYRDPNPTYCKNLVWTGSEESIFKKFNLENNSLRYCNGSHYQFKDNQIDLRYREWLKSLSKATRFKMHYGNGVVD